MELDFEGIIKRAKHFIIQRGVNEEEAEDFAQNCAIKAFEIGGPVNFEYMYLNYREFERADKRILSVPQGSITAFRTISTATPIDSSDSNSPTLDSCIGDSRDELGDREELDGITGLVSQIICLAKNKLARDWCYKKYKDWLEENVF